MSMNINMVSGDDLNAARVGFHAAFLAQMGTGVPEPLERLYAQVPSSNAIEEWQWMGDLPGMDEWKGDRKLGGLEWFKLRIENKDWAGGLRLHQKQLADDQTGMLQIQIGQLAQKARRHRIDLIVKALINGFTGLAYPEVGNGLGYDGAFFFSTTHTMGGSNRLALALSATALETAELLLQGQTNYEGTEPLDLHGTHLIVGPKLQFEAERLLKTEYLATGESNIHRGRYEVLVSPRLTGAYDDYWFLADLSAPIKPMIFQLREDITTSAIVGDKGGSNDSLPRFKHGELWFGVEARYNVGYFEHRTIVGSIV